MADYAVGLEWDLFSVQFGTVALVLFLVNGPVDDDMARDYTAAHDLRVERAASTLMDLNPTPAQSWPRYFRSALVTSATSASRP